MTVSSRLDKVESYVHLNLKQKAQQLEKETGRKVLDLGAGNPHLSPSTDLVTKLKLLLGQAENYQYPGYGAIPEFSQSLVAHYQNNYGVQLTPSQVIPVLGAKDGINTLTLALADIGDEVLVPDPGYPAYQGIAQLYGIRVIPYVLSQNNDFQLDITEIKKKTTAKTKLIWVNFPANPTGQVTNHHSLIQLVKWCQKKQIWLLYDNAYSQIYFNKSQPISILQIPGAEKIAVEIGSLSKSHSIAGLRVGWVVGNEEIINAVKKVKSQIDSGMSLSLQKLAASLLANNNHVWQKNLLSSYQESISAVEKLLTSLDIEVSLPQAGLYFWVKIPIQYDNSEQYADYLLKKKLILVTPGTAFGRSGTRYIRVSITQYPELIESYI